MSDTLDFDQFGCGLQENPEGYKLCTPAYEDSAQPILQDSEILSLLTDPNRTTAEVLFDQHWVVEGNQSTYNSCNGWAAASVLSKARFKRGIQDGVVLSGAYVYSLINGGVDQGSGLDQSMAELGTGGAPPASLVTANMIFPNLQPAAAKTEAAKHKGAKCYHTTTKQGFRSGISLGFLGVVAVQVAQRGFFRRAQVDSNHILQGVDNGRGNHAIHVDDMKMINGVEYFRIVNNWGLTWGYQGWAYVTWAMFQQTFGTFPFYLVPTTTEAV